MRAHVSLTTEGVSAKHLEVNGQQIPGVTNVDISVSAEGIPTANITLIALDALIFDGDAEVNLTAQTEDTLRLLGWTKAHDHGGVTGNALGVGEPFPKIVGHEQVLHPDGHIMCEPVYQRPDTRVETEDYPPTDSHFPDIGGRR